MYSPLAWAAAGTGFTFFMTALGASMVFLPKKANINIQRIFLGFAAGVMIAASIWSLLIPAIEEASEKGWPGWIPAAGGFNLGCRVPDSDGQPAPHLHLGETKQRDFLPPGSEPPLLVFAVTLHNIPEGMAVGVSFALAAQTAMIRPCIPLQWP